jgi:hypothetical protein
LDQRGKKKQEAREKCTARSQYFVLFSKENSGDKIKDDEIGLTSSRLRMGGGGGGRTINQTINLVGKHEGMRPLEIPYIDGRMPDTQI